MRMNMCQSCYDQQQPLEAKVTLFTHVRDTCDFCGKPNLDGIYVSVAREEDLHAQSQNKEQS